MQLNGGMACHSLPVTSRPAKAETASMAVCSQACAYLGLLSQRREGEGCMVQAIHEVAERHGYGVVREFVGHGVGRVFHAAPHVMHCRNAEPGVMQVLTVEVAHFDHGLSLTSLGQRLMPQFWW